MYYINILVLDYYSGVLIPLVPHSTTSVTKSRTRSTLPSCHSISSCGTSVNRHTYLDLFSERARLVPSWPLRSSQLNTASRLLLAGLFQLFFFAFSTFFVLLAFSHFFRFFVSSFL